MDLPHLLEQSNKQLSIRAFEGTVFSVSHWGCNQSCSMDPAELCEGLRDLGWLVRKGRMDVLVARGVDVWHNPALQSQSQQ